MSNVANLKPFVGPFVELATLKGMYPALLECEWDRIQHLSYDPKRKKAFGENKK